MFHLIVFLIVVMVFGQAYLFDIIKYSLKKADQYILSQQIEQLKQEFVNKPLLDKSY